MTADAAEYSERIRKLHQELGIPSDYAVKRGLALQPEATSLVCVEILDGGRECLLAPEAAEAWRTMRKRAANAGVELVPLSGFRSVDRQAEIVRGKRALGESMTDVLRALAAPGYSEHHTGRAIDVGTPHALPLEEAFATTAAYAWLERHGAEFGFYLSYPPSNQAGFVHEPWHWFWRGWHWTSQNAETR